jgi:hypothetical protein
MIDINDARGQTFTDTLGETVKYQHVDISQECELHDAVDVAVETWGQPARTDSRASPVSELHPGDHAT